MSVLAAYDRLAHNWYGSARALIAPEVRNSQYDYAERLRGALQGSGRWLDIGCGHDFLPPWMPPRDRSLDVERWNVIGIDMDASAIARHPSLRHRVVGTGERLPFDDASFNLITANMVVEHVAEPGRLFAEISRVLAPGGRVILHTPNVRGYTTRLTRLLPDRALAPLAAALLGRKAADIYPTYYRANDVADIRGLAAACGLVVDTCELVNSSPQAVRIPPLMLLELLLMRATRTPQAARLRACLLATMWKPANGGSNESVSRSELSNYG